MRVNGGGNNEFWLKKFISIKFYNIFKYLCNITWRCFEISIFLVLHFLLVHTSFIHLSFINRLILKKEQKRDVLVISYITRSIFKKILLFSEPFIHLNWLTGFLFSGLLYWNLGGTGGRFDWSSHYSFLLHSITCTCFACICFKTLSRSFNQVE